MSNKKDFIGVVLGLFIIVFISFFQFLNLKVPVKVILEKEKYSYIPQFVILSFDGSKSIQMWKNTREFAKEMQASSTPVHFTYFINAVYFLTKEEKDLYQGPRHEKGETPIGFSDNKADVVERVNQVNQALKEGHEIGSHAAGHFIGGDWSYEEWKQEFEMFNSVLFRNTGLDLQQKDITGFRAPGLGVNENTYKILKDKSFRYDASGVDRGDRWPQKDQNGLWHYPLGTIYLGVNKHPVLSMDYNIWLYQTEGFVRDRSRDLNDVVSGYINYFEKNYRGNRAPIIIGHHFSDWNDNVYWEAMKIFAKKVCTQPQVKCVSFRELTDYLDEYGVPKFVKK